MRGNNLFLIRFVARVILVALFSSVAIAEEGSPEFDLTYGIEAYQAGDYYEAMFALERVVFAEPENMRARYVLAKTYHEMGNDESARREFKIVQANNPPADIAAEVAGYLVGLEGKNRQGTLLGYVEGFVGHDDNINRATTDTTVTLPLPFTPPFELLPNARQQSDMYRTANGHLQYFQPLSESLGVTVKGSVSDKNFFSSDDFDETVYSASASVNKKIGKDFFKAGMLGQSYQLDHSSYSVTRGVNGSWQHEFPNGQGVSAGLGYNEINYPGNGLFNVDQNVFHASIYRRYHSYYHSLGYMSTNETSENPPGDYNARDTQFWFYDSSLYLGAKNSIQSRVLYSETERDAVDPAFLIDRDDDFLSLTLTWQWRYDEHVMVNTRLGVSDNDSDISMYEYERRYLETGVRYTF